MTLEYMLIGIFVVVTGVALLIYVRICAICNVIERYEVYMGKLFHIEAYCSALRDDVERALASPLFQGKEHARLFAVAKDLNAFLDDIRIDINNFCNEANKIYDNTHEITLRLSGMQETIDSIDNKIIQPDPYGMRGGQ